MTRTYGTSAAARRSSVRDFPRVSPPEATEAMTDTAENDAFTVTYTQWGVYWPGAVSDSLPSGVIPVADEATAYRVADGNGRLPVRRTIVRTEHASTWERVIPPDVTP